MATSALRVLSVVSEVFPLIKTGGLADVAGALPGALAREGVPIRTLVPGYPAVLRKLTGAEPVKTYAALFGGPATLLAGKAGDLDLFVIDAPHLYARDGNPYLASNGSDWPDNAFRFAALGRVAADIGLGAVGGYVPDVIHGHDWQAGLAFAYLEAAEQPRPGTLFTIHNMAFAGQFPNYLMPQIGLPWEMFTVRGLEYWDTISFLKAGLTYADRITTVSPTYATEILTPENGMGFETLLRSRAAVLAGVRNGIDETVWNPATDVLLPQRYSAALLDDRAKNKAALQTAFGLPVAADRLLLGVVSRLSAQKGLDLLLSCIPLLVELDAQLVLLGSGDRWMEDAYRAAALAHPAHIACRIGYDESIAHVIQAGSDAILVPSRFEPCGLTQLCALRYGAVPIVARVGGLADTVVDANEMALASNSATGFQFSPVTAQALQTTLRRVAVVYQDRPTWTRMVQAGMKTDVSWRRPARRMAELYRMTARQAPPLSSAKAPAPSLEGATP
jgi:starch synthase